jgi:hypothetical protein
LPHATKLTKYNPLALLDMDNVHRNIEFLQILEQSAMIVSGDFQHYV